MVSPGDAAVIAAVIEVKAAFGHCCLSSSTTSVVGPAATGPTAAAGSAIASNARTIPTCLIVIAASFGSRAGTSHAFLSSRIRRMGAPGAAPSARSFKGPECSAPPTGRQRRSRRLSVRSNLGRGAVPVALICTERTGQQPRLQYFIAPRVPLRSRRAGGQSERRQ